MDESKVTESHPLPRRRTNIAYKLIFVYAVTILLILSSLMPIKESEHAEEVFRVAHYLGSRIFNIINIIVLPLFLLLFNDWIDPNIDWERYIAEHEIENLYSKECQDAELLSQEVMEEWQGRL